MRSTRGRSTRGRSTRGRSTRRRDGSAYSRPRLTSRRPASAPSASGGEKESQSRNYSLAEPDFIQAKIWNDVNSGHTPKNRRSPVSDRAVRAEVGQGTVADGFRVLGQHLHLFEIEFHP